jgi:hypothetical protein
MVWDGVELDSDVEGRELSLFIFPSAAALFTAALLGVDSIVDIIRAGGRPCAWAGVVGGADAFVGGAWNRDTGDGGRYNVDFGSSFIVGVGLGVEGVSERADASVGEPTKGEDTFDVEFDSGEEPDSDSESSRGFPGQYKSSSNISNAPLGFITRVTSSNNASHCMMKRVSKNDSSRSPPLSPCLREHRAQYV